MLFANAAVMHDKGKAFVKYQKFLIPGKKEEWDAQSLINES